MQCVVVEPKLPVERILQIHLSQQTDRNAFPIPEHPTNEVGLFELNVFANFNRNSDRLFWTLQMRSK